MGRRNSALCPGTNRASCQLVPIRPLRSSVPSWTSVAQTQRLEGLIIMERRRGTARVKRGDTHQAPVAHDGPAEIGEGGGEVRAAVHAAEADGVERPQRGLVGLRRYTRLRMPGGRGVGRIHPPASAPGQGTGKKAPQVPPPPTPGSRLVADAATGPRAQQASPCPALTRHKEEPDPHPGTTHIPPIPRAAPTLSSTTSVIWGSPSGFCMLAKMNWKPSRNSLSYRFFSSGFSGFHCSAVGGKRETLM